MVEYVHFGRILGEELRFIWRSGDEMLACVNMSVCLSLVAHSLLIIESNS